MKFKKIITLVVTICLVSILLTIPAFATVTESDGDGYALYNGVKLPVFSQLHQYNVIGINKVTALAFSSDSPASFMDNEWIFTDGINVAVYACVTLQGIREEFGDYTITAEEILEEFDIVVDTWVLQEEVTSENSYNFTSANPMWSDYDVLSSSNSVQLPASNPVPLDGMNVIEWDGDITGLTSYEFNGMPYYKLTDYSNASSALCVVSTVDGYLYTPEYVASGGDWYCMLEVPGCIASNTRNSISSVYIGDGDGSSASYCSLIAYRPGIEPPPGEGGGGGDDPEEPQPPCGVARYNYY